MKKTQRECIQFGNLVMEGRDIGTNIFPETDYKYYLDAHLEERSRRRAAEGVNENLAARDQRDSQRAAAPLMIALGAKIINNSGMTAEQTSKQIIDDFRSRLETVLIPARDELGLLSWLGVISAALRDVFPLARVQPGTRALEGPVILASNHASFIDPPLVGGGLHRADQLSRAREPLSFPGRRLDTASLAGRSC